MQKKIFLKPAQKQKHRMITLINITVLLPMDPPQAQIKHDQKFNAILLLICCSRANFVVSTV